MRKGQEIDMMELPLYNSNLTVKVDNDIYERFKDSKIYLHVEVTGKQYAYIQWGERVVGLHKLILPDTFPLEVDHIDEDGLNDLRENLRPVTHQQNTWGSVKRKGTSSKYKGVYWNKRDRVWHAYIDINDKRKHLLVTKSEIIAALAYNQAAQQHFGKFARLNKIPQAK